MKPEELDHVLSGEADIVPSSGFVASVMEAVTAEATAPPLMFPWKRAWPLAAGFPVLFVWLALSQIGPGSATPGPDLYEWFEWFEWFETIAPMATGWVAGGLMMSAAITIWSLRLIRLR
jgi:hypothetical protein